MDLTREAENHCLKSAADTDKLPMEVASYVDIRHVYFDGSCCYLDGTVDDTRTEVL